MCVCVRTSSCRCLFCWYSANKNLIPKKDEDDDESNLIQFFISAKALLLLPHPVVFLMILTPLRPQTLPKPFLALEKGVNSGTQPSFQSLRWTAGNDNGSGSAPASASASEDPPLFLGGILTLHSDIIGINFISLHNHQQCQRHWDDVSDPPKVQQRSRTRTQARTLLQGTPGADLPFELNVLQQIKGW